MSVRRLTVQDAGAYRALMLQAYRLHPEAFTSSLAERACLPASWWESRTCDDPSASQVVFGACVERALVGAVGVSFESREKTRHKATLFGLYVTEGFRMLGMGRNLVDAVLEHARTRPETMLVQLSVTAGNQRAQRLYAACGFAPFGTEPMAVRVGDGFAAKVHMWCTLHPPPPAAPT